MPAAFEPTPLPSIHTCERRKHCRSRNSLACIPPKDAQMLAFFFFQNSSGRHAKGLNLTTKIIWNILDKKEHKSKLHLKCFTQRLEEFPHRIKLMRSRDSIMEGLLVYWFNMWPNYVDSKSYYTDTSYS